MTLNKTYKLHQIKVEPEIDGLNDVVLFIRWSIEFELDGFTNSAVIETLLDFAPNENFVSLEKLTKEQIINWAIEAQGGQSFIDHLEFHHGEQLKHEKARSKLSSPDSTMLSFELDEEDNVTMPQATEPQPNASGDIETV